jgi:hypothetical protein
MDPVSVGKDLPTDGDPVYPGAVLTSQIFQFDSFFDDL